MRAKAWEILESVKGKVLTKKARVGKAIMLAEEILLRSQELKTNEEKQKEEELHQMMLHPLGKVIVTQITDQAFRSSDNKRAADQMIFLLEQFGIPDFLSFEKKLGLTAFYYFGKYFPNFFVPLAKNWLRKETEKVIIPGEEKELLAHIKTRIKENVHVNLNHLGEAILGEEEAKSRLQTYLEDLKKPEIECVSIKISTIYSQINLLAWDETLSVLKERLRELYRNAKKYRFQDRFKFVYLDMEEYKDLSITVALFKELLQEDEFFDLEAGIVLQSYLPDSFAIQKELTQFAMERTARGGAPIKIRLVKGANMALEEFEAALQGWPKAPYPSKLETDANYKKMMFFGTLKEHAEAVHLGIGSHNLFDIALGLILRAEREVEPYVGFEMLEGMADPIRRAVSEITGDILLYCPAAEKKDFVNAVAYLVRRLDENSARENFLRNLFGLEPRSPVWFNQATLFRQALDYVDEVSEKSRRDVPIRASRQFTNEPNVDWTIKKNRDWIQKEIKNFQTEAPWQIPNVISEVELFEGREVKSGFDPSFPENKLYEYSLATDKDVDKAVISSKVGLSAWSQIAEVERQAILNRAKELFIANRGRLIAAMQLECGKPITEADPEVSEAIDFIKYYIENRNKWLDFEDLSFHPKGTSLVVSPWNFPVSIPVSGIAASLLSQNSVIFKPASEAILTGYELAKIFWEAGVPKNVLQFVACEDEPVGTRLVSNPEVNNVLLTGSRETARLFMKFRPGLDLIAESGGKNAIIVSAMADRDLAIKNILQSAFSYAGQKCSACSLLILEKEVYEDQHFLEQLKNAAMSLNFGNAHEAATKIPPLIAEPSEKFLKALNLESGESWLLEPKQDQKNKHLFSPGIKLGVKPASFTFKTELFGPILGVVKANSFKEALQLANLSDYGLTAGLESLDEREQKEWASLIKAGNLYINRPITGAIVERQPFGGCKDSSFGPELKVGGPNFLLALANVNEKKLIAQGEMHEGLKGFFDLLPIEVKAKVQNAFLSYSYYFSHYFRYDHDPASIRGQDNLLRYVPRENQVIRFHDHDVLEDFILCAGANLICQSQTSFSLPFSFKEKVKGIKADIIFENEKEFIERLKKEPKKVRMVSSPLNNFLGFLSSHGFDILIQKVHSHGRVELLRFLREEALSIDYHRYGNLGLREMEKLKRAAAPALNRDCTQLSA